MDWIAALPAEEQVVNLYFSMDTFGSFLPASTGIFLFMKALPRFAAERNITFAMPSEVSSKLKPVDELSVPYPMSDIDEARDVSAWKGNDLQREALGKLYSVAERVSLCDDRKIKQDWEYLQSSDHFYYMSTKNMADGASHAAFSIDNEELNSLLLTIRNQAAEINSLNKEVKTLRANIINDDTLPVVEAEEVRPHSLVTDAPREAGEKAPKKRAARKSSAKTAQKKTQE